MYIAGWSRSGSTILANILGSVPGFTSIGELHYLWEVGIQGREPCGCGTPLSDCPFWAKVLGHAFDTQPLAVAYKATRVLTEKLRTRHAATLIRKSDDELLRDPAIAYYSRVLGAVYRNVAKVSGAQIIVDSSKYPSDAAILRLIPGIRPLYLHLVRDPRAVAFSWSRTKRRSDRHEQKFMPTYGPLYSSANWLLINLLIEWLRMRADDGKSLLIRYEDFVSRPEIEIGRVTSWADGPNTELPFTAPTTAILGVTHTVNGNPARLKTGPTEIRRDDAWIGRMSPGDKAMVTASCFALMPRYNYRMTI